MNTPGKSLESLYQELEEAKQKIYSYPKDSKGNLLHGIYNSFQYQRDLKAYEKLLNEYSKDCNITAIKLHHSTPLTQIADSIFFKLKELRDKLTKGEQYFRQHQEQLKEEKNTLDISIKRYEKVFNEYQSLLKEIKSQTKHSIDFGEFEIKSVDAIRKEIA